MCGGVIVCCRKSVTFVRRGRLPCCSRTGRGFVLRPELDDMLTPGLLPPWEHGNGTRDACEPGNRPGKGCLAGPLPPAPARRLVPAGHPAHGVRGTAEPGLTGD